MLRGHMKCCPSAVDIFLLKGHTIPYLVRNVWYLVRNMWLPSRCTSHSPSAPYLSVTFLWPFGDLWWPFGDLSVTFRWPFGDLSVTFWWPFGDLFVTFRWPFGDLSVTFRLPNKNVFAQNTTVFAQNLTPGVWHWLPWPCLMAICWFSPKWADCCFFLLSVYCTSLNTLEGRVWRV